MDEEEPAEFLIRDQYVLRCYAKRDPNAYYRCGNRKDKCKVRLAINSSTNTETLKGEHLPSCQRVENANDVFIKKKKIEPPLPLQGNLDPFSSESRHLNTIQNTIDGQPFVQYITLFPTWTISFFTNDMKEFAHQCENLIFATFNEFCPNVFKSFLVIFGEHDLTMKPIGYIFLSEGSETELGLVFNFFIYKMELPRVKVAYITLDTAMKNLSQKFKFPVKTHISEIKKRVYTFFADDVSSVATISRLVLLIITAQDGELIFESLKQEYPHSKIISFFDIEMPDGIWNIAHELPLQFKIDAVISNMGQLITSTPPPSTINEIAPKLREIEYNFREDTTPVPPIAFPPEPVHQMILDYMQSEANA